MILWLSSFPRSGNTFLRSMFRQAFGLYSYSIYNDLNDIGGNEDVRHEVGHLFINGSIQDFYEESMRSAGIVPVKTHDPPMDLAPAIYVVRDGRAALVSYWNFLRRVRRRHELTLGEVIRGSATKFGSWSEHVKIWSPLSRPNTLLLRYENLVGDSETAIAKIAAFTGRKPIAKWQDNFQRMQTAFPDFFNVASNAKNIAQMNADDLALFWSLHRDCMTQLDYKE